MSGVGATMTSHATPALAEADRLMTVCNACRYCEGLCAVFPAMELRRIFTDGDLDYIANLCHACGACYIDCQFSPPHEYDVNVPKALAIVRNDSYERYAWPQALAPLFQRNGLWISLSAALGVAAFIAGFVAANDPQALWGVPAEPGGFYTLMPHGAMAAIFGLAFGYALVALALSIRTFWRATAAPGAATIDPRALWRATRDAATLRYLDGGGAGCHTAEDAADDTRRIWHHATSYGFGLCFAATAVATLYHYLAGREAPYPWWDAPVLLGVMGGVGLVVGPIGLLAGKSGRDPDLADGRRTDMDSAFLLMLLATGATGLALLVLRSTPAMGLILAVHLGVVLALFLTMPYGKFVHGLYRFAALIRYAYEMGRL